MSWSLAITNKQNRGHWSTELGLNRKEWFEATRQWISPSEDLGFEPLKMVSDPLTQISILFLGFSRSPRAGPWCHLWQKVESMVPARKQTDEGRVGRLQRVQLQVDFADIELIDGWRLRYKEGPQVGNPFQRKNAVLYKCCKANTYLGTPNNLHNSHTSPRDTHPSYHIYVFLTGV